MTDSLIIRFVGICAPSFITKIILSILSARLRGLGSRDFEMGGERITLGVRKCGLIESLWEIDMHGMKAFGVSTKLCHLATSISTTSMLRLARL